jgi:type I restriction enzyme, S subunit
VSHLEWATQLPAKWEAKPLRSVADYVVSNVDKVPAENERSVRLCNYTDVYNNELITLELDFMQTTASEDEIARFGLLLDDVVITKDSESWDDIGVPALVRETASNLVCGYHLALLRAHKQKMNGAFLFRCLQAKPVRVQLELVANGVTRFGLPKSEIGAMILPVPPLPQQRAIASYLDRETARLDALVAVKERVLRLLAEKRRALITCAVTRGLDPRAPRRDSGIPWLGEIPAHWCTPPVYSRFQVQLGKMLDEKTIKGTHLAAYLRNVDVQWGAINSKDLPEMDFGDDDRTRYALRVGDILVCEGGEIGRCAMWDGTLAECYYQKALHRLRPLSGADDARFFIFVMRTIVEAGVFSSHATAATIQHLPAEKLRVVRYPSPPISEQRAIVSYIVAHEAKLDALRLATERTIALLKERRSALIAAAVTGQIDVGATA